MGANSILQVGIQEKISCLKNQFLKTGMNYFVPSSTHGGWQQT
jgi:hypothetical protein